MPNGTDTRIVQMQFDNRQFERNIKTSGKSLEKFKKLLNFDTCEKALDKFSRATEQLTFDKMADNLQKLTDKFTGLGTVSELIISQVRHGLESAAASARRFTNSMTIDQVNAGFDKFGKLNKQVQTIMAATSRSEEDVYAVLKRLNDYTDQTSYNFVDMAANIGKFTSVGINLEDAEKQMEGIANWAARSGGGIQEASRAMYNLSQAMGVGALTKIDWKSIENAGMATKEFKEQLIQAGLATGNLVKQNGKIMTAKSLGKQVEVTYKNLAETLSKKWADTNVMQKAFMSYYYEDIFYTGEIATGVKTEKEQRDAIREMLKEDKKIDVESWKQLVKESDEIRNRLLESKKIDTKRWEELDIDSDEAKQKIIDAAVEQKKLLKEVNEEGYTVYKTLAKNGKQIEINTKNFDELLKRGIIDETMLTVVFGLDMDPLIESTEEQKQALKDALGEDDIILKKDWVENLKDAGLANDEFKQAAMDAAVAAGTLKKETDKAGNTIYKTAKGFGKETVVTLQNFEETLKNKWFTKDVADKAVQLENLGESAYESAQKCMTFTDVLDAWRDQLSTGWMNSFNKIFGELSESMELFSNICNKVGSAFSDLIDLRNRILDVWAGPDGSGRTNLWSLIVGEVTDEGEVVAYEGAYGFLDVMKDIGEMISTAFWETLKLLADPGAQLNWDEDGYREVWLATSLNNAVTAIRDFISRVHEFFSVAADGSNKTRWQQIQDVVNAIFATFVLAESVIRDVSEGLAILFDQEHFGPAIDALLNLFSELGLTISSTASDAQQGHGLIYLFKQLDLTCRPLISALNELIVTFATLLAEFLKTGRESGNFKALWDVIVGFINSAAASITKYGTPIVKFFTEFIGIVGRLLQNGINMDSIATAGQELKASLKTMLDTLFDGIPNFSERASALWTTIKDWFANGFKQEDWDVLKAKLKSALKIVLGVLPDTWQESIKSTYHKIRESFSQLSAKIKAFFSSVIEAFKSGFSEASLKKIADKAKSLWAGVIEAIPKGIGEAATNAYNSVVKWVNDLWAKITGFFNSLFGGKDNPVDNVVTKILPSDKAADAVEGAKKKNVFEQIIDYLTESFTNLKTSFQKLLGNDKGDAGSFGEALKQLDWGKIMVVLLGVLGGVGIIVVITQIIHIVKLIIGALDTIHDLVEEGLKIGPEAKKANIGEIMMGIAGAIAIIAASLTVIANLKADDAWRALEIVGVTAAVLLVMATFMKFMYKDASIGEAGSAVLSMVGIAVAIGQIIAAIMVFKDFNPKQMHNVINGLFWIVVAMVALSAAAKKGNLSFKDTAGVLAFCAGVWLLINALDKIKDYKPEQLLTMLGFMAAILLELGVFAWALKKFGGGMAGSGMKEAAFLAAAIGILIFALTPLATMKWDQLGKMGAGLGVILAALFGFMVGVNKLAKGGLKDMALVQLIAVAGSIMMLVVALLPLALLNWEQLGKMGAGFGVILAALWGFIVGVNKLAHGGLSNTAMAQLLAVAGSIVMIVLALMPLALMKWDQLGKMGAGFAVILAALWGFIIGVNKITKGGGLKDTGMVQLLAIAGAIALVVISLMPLALMEWDQLGRMGAGFVVIMVMFSGIIAAAKRLKGKSAAGAFLMMIGIAGLMYTFAMALTMIPADMNWERIAAFAGGLAAIIAAIGLAMLMAKGLSVTSAIAVIIALAGSIAAIMGVIGLLAPLLMDRIGTSVQKMSAQLSLIGGMFVDFMDYMNQISESDLDSAKAKFTKMYELITSLKDVSLYLPAINDFAEACLLLGSGLHQFIFSTSTIGDPEGNNGIKLLEKILSYKDQLGGLTGARSFAEQALLLGTGLSLFNTSVTGSAGEESPAFSMLDKLLGYGNKFSQLNGAFGAAIQMVSLGSGLNIFNTQSAGITDDNPKALQLLTNMAGNADSLDKLSKIDLSGFSDQMAGLGGALSIYALGVKDSAGIEIGEMPDVSGAIAILSSLTQGLSNDMGELAIPTMPDETVLTNFGVQLAALAGGLIQFATASEGLGEGTDKALKVLEFMRDLKTDLTPDNLKVTQTFSDAGIYGDHSLISFGTEISALGSSLKTYNDSVTNFTKNQAALDVLSFMADLKGKLTVSNLLVTSVFKDAGIYSETALSTFGVQMAALGKSIGDYNTSVKDFKKNQDALDAIDFFFELQKKLTGEEIKKELFEVFTGQSITKETLSSFGTDIGTLGEALAGFAANVNFSKDGTGEVKSDFDNAIKSLDMLQKLSVQLPKYGGITQAWEGATLTLTQLSGDIRSTGEALGQFSDELSAVGKNSGKSYDVELVKGALEAVQVIVQMAGDMTKEDNLGEYTAYNYVDRLTQIMHMLLEVPEFMGGNKQDTFINNVVDFMKRFQDASNAVGGIGDATIFQSFSNLASGIQKMAQTDPAFDFKQIGLNMDSGIEAGIKEGSISVATTAADMALAAYIAAKEAIDSNSPSKLFMSLGSFASEGMAIGIANSADQAADASASLANGTIDSAKGILANISSILASDVDSQPTIRPVLDLSNVTAGARELDGMFGDTYGLGIDPSSARARASRTYVTTEAVAVDQNGIDSYGALARLDAMLENVQKMGESISNMKLVLDTGAVAGGVSDDVDIDIGRKMFYATRRN